MHYCCNMDDHEHAANWDRVAQEWGRIGELVGGSPDRAEAHRRLVTELEFDEHGADQVLALRIADIVQFGRPYKQIAESSAHEEWQVRGRGFTPREFRPDERDPWSQWIREGVESGWLNVVRLRETGVLRALSRTNDDRSIYVEHRRNQGGAVQVHTSIGGTYAHGDDTLWSEIVDGVVRSSDGFVDDEAINQIPRGPVRGWLVQLDGTETAARALISQEWWAVSVSVDPITNAYVTGQGDEIPALDLVTVQSFAELDDQTAARR